MTREEALSFLNEMFNRLGFGYHPDSPLSEYVNPNDTPTFSKAELKKLQPKHDAMMEVLGEEVYELGKKWDIANY